MISSARKAFTRSRMESKVVNSVIRQPRKGIRVSDCITALPRT